jgi:hypothetical protein
MMNMLLPKPRAGNAYGRKLIDEARALGWDCRTTGKNHLRFVKGEHAVTAPGTPRDPDRSLKKTLSRLRRLDSLSMVAP